MKPWPPALPPSRSCTDALGQVIVNAKALMEANASTKRERAVAACMDAVHTSIAVLIADDEMGEWEGKLVVSLEVERTLPRAKGVRRGKQKVEYCTLDTELVHQAVNEITKARATVLADMLAHDFVEFLDEQREFAEQAGAEAEELATMLPSAYDKQLRVLHKLVRMRVLPLTPQA
jgi:hypothetical protein